MRAGTTLSRRLREQDGFTMLLAIGVLALTAVLVTAIWLAVRGDTTVTQQDLEGKRAYSAASAAVNVFLYDLNQDPNYWDTCSHDAQSYTAVPGATNEWYSWSVIPANGYSACSTSSTESSLIDNTTGSLRIEFSGYAGNSGSRADPQVKRTIVAGFREKSPFDFLWYTVYEELDSSITGNNCAVWYRNNPPSQCSPIDWISQDVINGPMYTEDQYHIGSGSSPTFGRNSSDNIESAAPGSGAGYICAGDSCGSAVIKGTAVPGAALVSPPSSNSFLATDALNHGIEYSGVTTITLSGTSATVKNCPSSCTTNTIDLTQDPVIYVANGSGCSVPGYTTTVASYPTSGCSGDVYVSGNYTTPLTIGAANNIIINGNLTTTTSGTTPTGSATLGLVANSFIRVEHGCSGGTNINGEYTQNLTIDAAIMAVQHSFIVDNYSCGSSIGTLTVTGAIAQYFRGTVGTHSGSTITSGYAKAYSYDDRLKYLLPPYLFDVSTAGWVLSRETTCGGSGSSTAC